MVSGWACGQRPRAMTSLLTAYGIKVGKIEPQEMSRNIPPYHFF